MQPGADEDCSDAICFVRQRSEDDGVTLRRRSLLLRLAPFPLAGGARVKDSA